MKRDKLFFPTIVLVLLWSFVAINFIWMCSKMISHGRQITIQETKNVLKRQTDEDKLELYKKLYPGRFDADYRSWIWSMDEHK